MAEDKKTPTKTKKRTKSKDQTSMKKVMETKKELHLVQAKIAAGKETDTSKIKKFRRQIARMLTKLKNNG